MGERSLVLAEDGGDGGEDLQGHKRPVQDKPEKVTPRSWHRKPSQGGGKRESAQLLHPCPGRLPRPGYI